jgi:hypothetical protein
LSSTPILVPSLLIWGLTVPAFAAPSMDPKAGLIFGGLALLLGLVAFFFGFRALQRKRLIEDTPTSTIRAMAPGQVEVSGRAVDWRPVTAPFTQGPCVYYQVLVEEERKRTVTTSKGTRTETYWVTIYQEDTGGTPFYLDDGTGKLRVVPTGADMVMGEHFHLRPGLFGDIPPHVVKYLGGKGVDCHGLFGFEKPLRFTEKSFAVGEPIFALGACRKSGVGNDAPEGAVGEYELGAGKQDELFILSDKSQKALTGSLGWQAFFGIFGGVALVGGGVWLLERSLRFF